MAKTCTKNADGTVTVADVDASGLFGTVWTLQPDHAQKQRDQFSKDGFSVAQLKPLDDAVTAIKVS